MPKQSRFKVAILRGDLTKQEADAIVNPASSLMYMGGGAAGAIKRVGGIEVEREALKHAPLPVGKAVATGAGRLGAKWVVHAPTMERPAMLTTVGKVYRAAKAALLCAEKVGARSIIMPGMGTGIGGVAFDEAARAMVKAVNEFSEGAKSLATITFCDIDERMIVAWQKAVLDAGF